MMDQQKIEMLLQEPVIIVALIVPIIIVLITQFSAQKAVADQAESSKSKRVVNLSIKKSEAKIVDKVDCGEIENLAEFQNGKLVMCRCWRSKTFPYCDGRICDLSRHLFSALKCQYYMIVLHSCAQSSTWKQNRNRIFILRTDIKRSILTISYILLRISCCT